MELLNSFMSQGMIAQIGEIVLFANTVTMAMPTRWRGNMMMDYISKILNYLYYFFLALECSRSSSRPIYGSIGSSSRNYRASTKTSRCI